MMKLSELKESLEEDRKKTDQALLKKNEESLKKFAENLESSFKSAESTIDAIIEREKKGLETRLKSVLSLNLRNWLLASILVTVGVAGTTWSLSYFLSRKLASQLQQIENNRFELSRQAEALKRGHFFKNPEDKQFYVRIKEGTDYKAQTGNHWAQMDLD